MQYGEQTRRLAAALGLAASCAIPAQPARADVVVAVHISSLTLANQRAWLNVDRATGRFSLAAYGRSVGPFESQALCGTTLVSGAGEASSHRIEDVSDALGEGKRVVLETHHAGRRLVTRWTLYAGRPEATVVIEAEPLARRPPFSTGATLA